MTLRFIVTSTLILFAASCTTLKPEPDQSESPASDAPPENTSTKPPLQYSQFSTETLYSLIVAEMAASRQQYPITLNNYIEQANNTGDLGIISRATRLAQYFRVHEQTLSMGKLWLAQAPDDIEANGIVANAYAESGQPLKALDHAEVILPQLAPDSEETDKSVALLETIANFSRDLDTLTKETLINRYQKLVVTYPDYPAIKVGLSKLYAAQQDTATAYKVIEEALSTDPDYLPAIMQEIRLLQASQQTDKAIAKLEMLLERRPDDNRLRLLYARLLTRTDINAAYDEFTRLSEQAPQQLDIQFSRALIALELKKIEEAKGILMQLLTSNYQPDMIHYYLGTLSEAEQNNEEALNHYLTVNNGEHYVSAHSRAARIMVKQGNLPQAKAHFAKLRENSPAQRSALYSAESQVLLQQGEMSLALSILTQGINEFPDDIALRYDRATLYEKNRQLALMESDLQHILTLQPNNAAALNALGYFLISHTTRYSEALDLIQKALAQKPDDPAIIDSMGWALFKLGRIDEAITYLRQAFELLPDPEVAAHLGEVLWTKGNKQEARNIWQNNLKDNPDDTIIIDTMERLNAR